jgi:hypothetical protein
MQAETAVQLLKQHSQAIAQLVSDVDIEQARWKPDVDSWSILEAVCHLADEEREDFRARLKHILDGTQAPEIDPGSWITERGYNQREIVTAMHDYLSERQASLEWLRTLTDTDWSTAFTTPQFSIRAEDILAAWVAHDLLHLRQLTELRYLYLQQQAQPYSVDYAGEW